MFETRLLLFPLIALANAAWRIDFLSPLPWWGLLALAAVALLLIVRAYRRTDPEIATWKRRVLAGLRLGVAAAVLFVLSQAILLIDETAPAPLVLILDDSSSMSIPSLVGVKGASPPPTRFEAAVNAVSDLTLDGPVRVVLPAEGIRFNADSLGEAAARLEEAVPTGEQTRLGDWILHELTDSAVPPRAIVLFSDGVSTAGPGPIRAAEEARRRGVPLFCVGPDGLKVAPRLGLSNPLAQQAVFPGDPVVFQVSLDTVGLKGKEVRIHLAKEGASKPVDERVLRITADGSQTVQLTARPEEPGRLVYTITATVPGRPNLQATTLTHAVDVRSEPIHILLAAEAPSFEYRFLSNLLAREDAISTHVFLRDADPLWIRQHPNALERFPADRDSLSEYDVVVLDDVSAESLGPAGVAALASAVQGTRSAPSLVWIAGSKERLESFRKTALDEVLPLRLDTVNSSPARIAAEGTRVAVTLLGLAFPPMQIGETPAGSRSDWQNLGPIYGYIAAKSIRPGAAVLLSTTGRAVEEEDPVPIIVTQALGPNRVWFQATDESWRWRESEGERDSEREREIGEDRERDPGAGVDEPLYARYWLQLLRYLALSRLDSSDLTGPSLSTKKPGTEVPPEQAVTVQDTRTLQQAAQISGGRFVPLDRIADLPKLLPPPKAAVIATSAPIPLWNSWYTLLVLFILLSAEWILRRHNRLI